MAYSVFDCRHQMALLRMAINKSGVTRAIEAENEQSLTVLGNAVVCCIEGQERDIKASICECLKKEGEGRAVRPVTQASDVFKQEEVKTIPLIEVLEDPGIGKRKFGARVVFQLVHIACREGLTGRSADDSTWRHPASHVLFPTACYLHRIFLR